MAKVTTPGSHTGTSAYCRSPTRPTYVLVWTAPCTPSASQIQTTKMHPMCIPNPSRVQTLQNSKPNPPRRGSPNHEGKNSCRPPVMLWHALSVFRTLTCAPHPTRVIPRCKAEDPHARSQHRVGRGATPARKPHLQHEPYLTTLFTGAPRCRDRIPT